MPSGRFLPGFLISPPIAATLVTPAYETRTRAAVSPMALQSSCVSRVGVALEKSASPFTIDQTVRMRSISMAVATIGVCTTLTFFTPRMLTIEMITNIPRAVAMSVYSVPNSACTTARYAENPMSAKAAFSRNDAHSATPVIEPINGPKMRSR